MATYTWSIPSGKEITGSTYLKDTDNYLGDTINDLVDFVNGEGVHENKGMTYDFVDKASDQTITGVKTFTQEIIGNINTATKLQTPRKINGVDFDGSSDINTFQAGMIMLWSGSSASIPATWYLCDGSNGTPNLIDRFVIGAGSTYEVGATGGSANAVVVSHTHTASADSQGSHTHSASTGSSGSHTHAYNRAEGYTGGLGAYAGNGNPNGGTATHYVSTAGAHTHTVEISAAGSHGHNIAVSTNGESGTNKNLPPYYALCYIMKG